MLHNLVETIKRIRKYDGRLVYQLHDDEGILEIIEHKGVRSLYFGSESRQSCMLIDDPDYLFVPYVRAMMSWHLFRSGYARVLMVGLGGGSLTKYLLHSFPGGRINVVEYRKSVVKIARSHFGLPLDSRLKLIIEDGGKYLRQAVSGQAGQYDLLFIDAFDHAAMSQSVDNVAVLDACRALLSDQGMLVMNLWGSNDAAYARTTGYLEQSFADRVLYLSIEGRGNVIAFAFASIQARWSNRELLHRSGRLAMHSGIEYPLYLKALKRQNPSRIGRFIK